jgi:hypothetical protein
VGFASVFETEESSSAVFPVIPAPGMCASRGEFDQLHAAC